MKDDIVVSFKYVSKIYKLFLSEKKRLTNLIMNKSNFKTKKAVSNVTFDIKRGESVAFFGKNGAGKSTILKLIAGVAYPTSGIVRVEGQIGALLELTAGFDSELTGRENIRYRGQLLGFSDTKIGKLETETIAFAELGDYIDQPVRTYSSGMKTRLGFALNVSVNPDILIIDEALSVGDRHFRDKCHDKLSQFVEEGKTFIFVTHSTATAKKFCNRGIVLKSGKVVFDGEIDDAILYYQNKY